MYITYKSEEPPEGLRVGVTHGIVCEVSTEKDQKPYLKILCRHFRSQLENKMFIEDVLEACRICGVLDE